MVIFSQGKKDKDKGKGKDGEKLPPIVKKKQQDKKPDKKQETKSETIKQEQHTSQKDADELHQAIKGHIKTIRVKV
jgi:hypothetical protein